MNFILMTIHGSNLPFASNFRVNFGILLKLRYQSPKSQFLAELL